MLKKNSVTMGGKALVLIILIILTITEISATIIDDNDEVPLSKSLGYAIKSNLNKNVEDVHLGRQYQELYQEMVRASKESFERVDDDEELKLGEVIGRKRAEMVKKGVIVRRRSAARMQSPLGRRHVRSQASRREKLQLQSLLSHRHHARKHRFTAKTPSPGADVKQPHYSYVDDNLSGA